MKRRQSFLGDLGAGTLTGKSESSEDFMKQIRAALVRSLKTNGTVPRRAGASLGRRQRLEVKATAKADSGIGRFSWSDHYRSENSLGRNGRVVSICSEPKRDVDF